jgi:hypothetical protein
MENGRSSVLSSIVDDAVEAYCISPNVEARQNLICDAIRQSVCVYPFGEGV